MTEEEWLLLSRPPDAILDFVQGKSSNRKIRLFACGCGRLIWMWLTHDASRIAIQTAERFADGQASRSELAEIAAEASLIAEAECDAVEVPGNDWLPLSVSAQAALTARFASVIEDDENNGELVSDLTAANNTIFSARLVAKHNGLQDPLFLLHDIFGNPFRPAPAIDPAWLRWHDATISRLAQQMYDSRDFASMPILADALEEAGCTSGEILEHCRGPGPHVRGCWVVDLVLEKE